MRVRCGGAGKSYSPTIRSQSEPLPLDCELDSFSFLCSPLLDDRMNTVGWSWVFPFSQVSQTLTIPQGVRPQLPSFS